MPGPLTADPALADTRDLKLFGERFSFFLQHTLLVGLPIVYLARRRFNVYQPRVVYSWAWKLLFHTDVLVPVSLLVGANLNYVVVRASGPQPFAVVARTSCVSSTTTTPVLFPLGVCCVPCSRLSVNCSLS